MNGATMRFARRFLQPWMIHATAATAVLLISSVVIAAGTVIEFYNPNLDNYFITANPIEAAAVDSGAAGPGWARTGINFGAGGPTPVCRFYGSFFPGPNSHFYTAQAAECDALKQLQLTTPATEKRWNFESLDFATALPAGGACPDFTSKIYRAYNNGFARGVDSNHRITRSLAGIEQVVSRGWSSEGVVMCAPFTAPQAGWWWNPSENGRWFFVESGSSDMEMAAYFYANDGRATWLSSGGANADPYSYSGRLLAYSGGQTLFGDYKAPAAPTDTGAISMSFPDDTHGTLTWPGGTVPVERRQFGGTDAPFQPDTGWWWNSDESGRQYSIEVQGDSIFIGAYMYDANGNPVWYYSSGKMASPTTYAGRWLQSANGQTLTGTYHPPAAPGSVSNLSVEFTAIDEAILTFSDIAPAAAQAIQPKAASAIKPIQFVIKRKKPAKPTYTLPARYDGSFTQKIVYLGNTSGITQEVTTTLTGGLTWVNDPELDALVLRQPARTYVPKAFPDNPKPITLTVHVTQDGGGGHCEGTFTETYPLSDRESFLDVNGFAQYVGHIKLDGLPGMITITCIYPDSGADEATVPVLLLPMDFKGATIVYGVTGGPQTTIFPLPPIGQITLTKDWSFAAVKAQ